MCIDEQRKISTHSILFGVEMILANFPRWKKGNRLIYWLIFPLNNPNNNHNDKTNERSTPSRTPSRKGLIPGEFKQYKLYCITYTECESVKYSTAIFRLNLYNKHIFDW